MIKAVIQQKGSDVGTKGTMLFERELPCEIEDIAGCLAGFPHPIEWVGFEAGTMSQHLFFGLKAGGFDVVCMEARQVNAALSAMRNKTDKNDARGMVTDPSLGSLAAHSNLSHRANEGNFERVFV